MAQLGKQVNVPTDTQASLKKALKYGMGHATIYQAGEYPKLPDIPYKRGMAIVLDLTNYEVVMKFHKAMPEKKIAVMNFVSPNYRKGKFPNTTQTLKESICHRSMLCPLISQPCLKESKFSNKIFSSAHEDYYILSEEAVVCELDDDCPGISRCENFTTVDALTCNIPLWVKAFPDDYTAKDNFSLYVKRVKHIMHIAAFHGADIFIAGAYGCGTFEIDPEIVATAWQEALGDYRKKFDYTIFAIHFKEHEIGNFKAFSEMIE